MALRNVSRRRGQAIERARAALRALQRAGAASTALAAATAASIAAGLGATVWEGNVASRVGDWATGRSQPAFASAPKQRLDSSISPQHCHASPPRARPHWPPPPGSLFVALPFTSWPLAYSSALGRGRCSA